MGERLMGDDDIPESDCGHHPEIGQVPKTYLPKLWIETGILHTPVLEDDQSSLIEDDMEEEPFHS